MSVDRSIPIIDTDTHVTEPPDLWTSRVSKKWGDQVLHVKSQSAASEKSFIAKLAPDQGDAWFIGDTQIAAIGQSAAAGWPEPFPGCPPTFEQCIPASHDASARLAYMDEVGIFASVLFPNVGGLGAQNFLKLGDPKLMLECVAAYNDHICEWAATDPNRLLPMTCTPYWDIENAPAEIERCAKIGSKGLVFSGAPRTLGMPSLSSRHWDPIWEAAQACDLPICFHVGSGEIITSAVDPQELADLGPETFYSTLSTKTFLDNGNQLLDLLMSGVLPRYENLKFVSVESGIGWIPFVLESCDYHFKVGRVQDARPEFKLLPSEYFQRQVYGCYWFEEIAPNKLIDSVGADNILFETDFPHPTCLYGKDEIDDRIQKGLGKQSSEVQRKILAENAAKLFKVELPN